MVSRRHVLAGFGSATVAASWMREADAASKAGGESKAMRGKSCAAPKTVIAKRTLGRTGHMVTPLALGGQASLQWTPDGVDAPDIIVRAVELGVNYLDSANAYGPSQMNYGEAFRRMNLVPGKPGYNAALRESLFVATKTTRRYARNPADAKGPFAIAELKRSMTQMWGDGNGAIPEGAYLNSIQMHNLTEDGQTDHIFAGMAERGGKMPEQIGALPALLDYRDGTNYTGLNPDHHRWVRHVGVTGHLSSPVLMRLLRLDEGNDIDTLLVALNVADKEYLPHQTNVLPLAVAKGMGVIAMKVFADGVFFGKEARWSRQPEDVITTVGDPKGRIAYHDMIRYTLSLPGVACAVIGTGHIDRKDPAKDQIVANLAAALDTPMTAAEREAMEAEVAKTYGATTNYFQAKPQGLVQPTDVTLTRTGDHLTVRWSAGYAGAKPIVAWDIRSGGKTLVSIPFRPQLTLKPLEVWLAPGDIKDGKVEVVAVEAA